MPSIPKNMQKFVMEGIPPEHLQEILERLRLDGCVSIESTPEGGGFTVTALCPIPDESD